MATLADAKAAWLQQYGYSGSISDMEYQYYSSPPVLNSYGFVRVATGPSIAISTTASGFTHYHRVIEGGTFTKIRIGIGVQSGNICLAAYKNVGTGLNSKPGNQIATTGSIPCPAPAVAAGVDIPMGSSVTVAAGDWLSLCADNLTVTFNCSTGSGNSNPSPGQFCGEVAYPAPAVANVSVVNSSNNSRMFVMVGVP